MWLWMKSPLWCSPTLSKTPSLERRTRSWWINSKSSASSMSWGSLYVWFKIVPSYGLNFPLWAASRQVDETEPAGGKTCRDETCEGTSWNDARKGAFAEGKDFYAPIFLTWKLIIYKFRNSKTTKFSWSKWLRMKQHCGAKSPCTPKNTRSSRVLLLAATRCSMDSNQKWTRFGLKNLVQRWNLISKTCRCPRKLSIWRRRHIRGSRDGRRATRLCSKWQPTSSKKTRSWVWPASKSCNCRSCAELCRKNVLSKWPN